MCCSCLWADSIPHSKLTIVIVVSTIQFPGWAKDPFITDQTLGAANSECSVLDMLTPDKCPVQIPIVSNIIDDTDNTIVMAYNSANGTEETKDMDHEYCEFSGLFHAGLCTREKNPWLVGCRV